MQRMQNRIYSVRSKFDNGSFVFIIEYERLSLIKWKSLLSMLSLIRCTILIFNILEKIMNKKYIVVFSNFVQKIILSLVFIFAVSVFAVAQAQQSIVDNPMQSASVKYGPYASSTNRQIQIQSPTLSQTTSKKVKSTGSSQKKNSTDIVNINSATETELVALPGIGPSKAHAIVEYRQSQGGFKSIDDLQKVKGIGSATLEKLRTRVTL
jgi:comEA protein